MKRFTTFTAGLLALTLFTACTSDSPSLGTVDAGASQAPGSSIDAAVIDRPRQIPWDWDRDSAVLPDTRGAEDGTTTAPPDAASSGDPGALTCRPYDFGSCLCSPDRDGKVATCTPASVKGPLQEAACCKSAFNTCWCFAFECRLSRSGYCWCGKALSNDPDTTPVPSCTPYTRSDHCCLRKATDTKEPACSCGPLPCGLDREVASCSARDVRACDTSRTEVAACKS